MATPALKLSQISIVMLGVKDLPRSVAFYRDTLGMAVQAENPEFAFLSGGGVTLALSLPLAKATGQSAGATEVVFAVEDVTAAYATLRARSVVFTHEPRNVTGTSWAANFNDPDGHRLSIFGPKTK